MENIELTTEEKKELEKRGFLSKRKVNSVSIILGIIWYIIYIALIGIATSVFGFFAIFFLSGELQYPTTISILLSIPCICSMIAVPYKAFNFMKYNFQRILNSFYVGNLFYTKEGLIVFNKRYKTDDPFITDKLSDTCATEDNRDIDPQKKPMPIGAFAKTIIGIPIFIIVISPFLHLNYLNYLIILIILTIPYFLIETILKSIHYFYPIYAFGNLGEKIQMLTPRIEEQSKKIQSEFQSDMNFSVLSDGFDSLSSTFSRIIALVLKLEKIETRANKGNLFDSEKYINSLRSDIVVPLQSLREFLETQKTKLLDSQKELTRVQAGGSEESGNVELQSKRSESLITELTENIEKLDVMIGKMG